MIKQDGKNTYKKAWENHTCKLKDIKIYKGLL